MSKASLAQQDKTSTVLSPMQGVLQRKCACGNKIVASGECMECAKKNSILQRKLTIGASHDPLEQEADRVADQVMAMPTRSAFSYSPPRIQRYEGRATEGLGTAPASVDRVLASSGRPLEPVLRQDMEQRFGHDFSQVRVQSGSAAEQSARDVNAHAYTVGNKIVFGTGQFAPSTSWGRRLLSHELTHVAQQSSTFSPSRVIQRKSKVSQRLGMRVVKHADGSIEITVNRAWSEKSGIGSTIIGMAHVTPGVTVADLIKEFVACGAYKSEKHIRERFVQGTRIVVKNRKILEISVRGKVYKVGGVQKPDFNYFLNEGARVFSRAGFGLSSGEKRGRDAGDGYDSRYWMEKGARGTIIARIPAWDAMDKMVKNIGKEVPKAGGGKTKWRFDCFEASILLRLYAIWRTTIRNKFNHIYRPLKLGFFASPKTGLGETISSEGPRMPAYKYVGGQRSGSFIFGGREVTLKKSINDIAIHAPIGSFVAFGSKDIQTRCKANSKLRICDFKFENTIKVGKDRFFAHPFGVVSSGTIFEKMAKAVGATPSLEYYQKNIYVSSVRYPK